MTSSPSSPSSSSSSSFEVDSAALLKILLHAAKHPSSDVLGVLVGRPPKACSGAAAAGDADGIDDVEASPAPSVSGRVVDVLPLFHESVGLTPMLEVALLQVRGRLQREIQRKIVIFELDRSRSRLLPPSLSSLLFFLNLL